MPTHPPMRLLLFNLMTDADDPVLGFTTVWINALAAHCEAVDVITMQAGRLALADNVRVYSVGKEKGYSEARRAVEFYRILFGLLRQHRYDACFAHMIQVFAVMGAPLLKLAGVPITLWYTHKATGRMLRLAEKLVAHIVTASPQSFGIPSSKVQVIGHGIDTDQFQPAPSLVTRHSSLPFTILTVSRLSPVKRLETVIAAVETLRQDGFSHVRLRLVGGVYPRDEAYAEGLRQMVADNDLSAAVEFVGGMTLEAVVREYQQADVVVNMTATGSMDKVALEAMACGIPVITPNEAFQSLLAPWSDLLLVPPEAPEMLALRLKNLILLPPDERHALGAKLRQLVVERHSLKQLSDSLIAIFKTKR
jgi:glycosyltransferase involved in cell wall biosynthesis